MTLTLEQIAKGWKLHDGSDVCPIKDDRTRHQVMLQTGITTATLSKASEWMWQRIIAYRIIEAHGADAEPKAMRCAECDCEKGGADCNWIKSGPDAEPARPTPFPARYDELVWDDAGWSQTIIVDGKRPEWLRDDDFVLRFVGGSEITQANLSYLDVSFAIRVRRREPKRETVECCLQTHRDGLFIKSCHGTIDLIDGKPDLSTLKIAEDAL